MHWWAMDGRAPSKQRTDTEPAYTEFSYQDPKETWFQMHLHLDAVSVPGISQHWIELLVLKERREWSGHLHHPNTHKPLCWNNSYSLHVPLLHCQGSASSTIHRHLHNSCFKEKGYSRNHEHGWILGSGPWSGFCVQRWLILIQSEYTNTHLCGLQKKVKLYCIFTIHLLG